MWISKEKYKALSNENATLKAALETKQIWEKLLDKATKNDERLIDILGKVTKDCLTISDAFNLSAGCAELILPESVAQYVDDYFGGKVIKQEAIKVIAIDKNGNVTYGKTSRTRKKSDFQRNYVLEEIT